MVVRASSSTSQDEQWWPIARQLGLRLQRARIAKGLSQEALAHAAGISTYTYQKFEKGESRPGTPMNPRLRTLIGLPGVFRTLLVFLLQAAFVKFRSSRSTSLGARYPRAE